MNKQATGTVGETRGHSEALLAAALAFGMWGLFPLYFKLLGGIPADEILAHRIIWSVVFVAIVLLFRGQFIAALRLFRDRTLVWRLTRSVVFLTINWLIFIWAVANDRVLETSLGYFITPLVQVSLAVLFLKERLKINQWIAVGLAVLAVILQVVTQHNLPWVAVSLAMTFGLYSLMRKGLPVDALRALFVETSLIAPLAVGYLAYLSIGNGAAFFHSGISTIFFLVLCGPVTAVPLILFGHAARNLRLSTIGVMQYIVPSLSFLQGVFLFNEPFPLAKALSFAIIWVALIVFSLKLPSRRLRSMTGT